MVTKAEILNPYTCGREECPNFEIALRAGVSEEDAIGICENAMARIIGSSPRLATEAIHDGITCGLFLADRAGEFGTSAAV